MNAMQSSIMGPKPYTRRKLAEQTITLIAAMAALIDREIGSRYLAWIHRRGNRMMPARIMRKAL
jgi:hypothetical protein